MGIDQRIEMSSAIETSSEQPSTKQRVECARGLDATDYKILDCLAEGLSNAAIARRLHYAESTIKNRVSRLLRHFGVESRTALIAVWLQSGEA